MPQNHAFGSARKTPVMPDCTKSRVDKCRDGIKTAAIGKNKSGDRFCLIDFLPIMIMWYTDKRNFGGQEDEIFIRERDS